MILRSSYTQSVFSVYPIYTEDIIERYLIKSINISDGKTGRTGKTGRVGKAGRTGRTGTGGTGGTSGTGVMDVSYLKFCRLRPLLKLKNILYRENEYRATTSIK